MRLSADFVFRYLSKTLSVFEKDLAYTLTGISSRAAILQQETSQQLYPHVNMIVDASPKARMDATQLHTERAVIGHVSL